MKEYNSPSALIFFIFYALALTDIPKCVCNTFVSYKICPTEERGRIVLGVDPVGVGVCVASFPHVPVNGY